jgi:hypothetical protein
MFFPTTFINPKPIMVVPGSIPKIILSFKIVVFQYVIPIFQEQIAWAFSINAIPAFAFICSFLAGYRLNQG